MGKLEVGVDAAIWYRSIKYSVFDLTYLSFLQHKQYVIYLRINMSRYYLKFYPHLIFFPIYFWADYSKASRASLNLLKNDLIRQSAEEASSTKIAIAKVWSFYLLG